MEQMCQLFVSHRKVLEQRDSVYEKISQYLQLRSIIQSVQVLFCPFYVVVVFVRAVDLWNLK